MITQSPRMRYMYMYVHVNVSPAQCCESPFASRRKYTCSVPHSLVDQLCGSAVLILGIPAAIVPDASFMFPVDDSLLSPRGANSGVGLHVPATRFANANVLKSYMYVLDPRGKRASDEEGDPQERLGESG